MDTRSRKQIERASRVVVFAREHRSEVPAEQVAVGQLEERLARAETVMQGARASQLGQREAIVERMALRSIIADRLQLLAVIARSAGIESLGAPIVIQFPGPRDNQVEFVNGARQAVTAATEREELLVKYGLHAGFLAELTGKLDEFTRLLHARDEAAQAKVGFHRELGKVLKDIRMAIQQLHASFRLRLRDDPGALRAWATAADVRIGPRRIAATPEGEAPLALPPGESEAGAVA